MYKNQDNQRVNFAAIARVDGTDATGVSPSLSIAIDGGTPASATGALVEVAAGDFKYSPSQAETDGDHLVFRFTEATVITQVVNVYTVDPSVLRADVSTIETELAKVIKSGEAATYTSGLGSQSVTATRD